MEALEARPHSKKGNAGRGQPSLGLYTKDWEEPRDLRGPLGPHFPGVRTARGETRFRS
jgi:hypothetical protein